MNTHIISFVVLFFLASCDEYVVTKKVPRETDTTETTGGTSGGTTGGPPPFNGQRFNFEDFSDGDMLGNGADWEVGS